MDNLLEQKEAIVINGASYRYCESLTSIAGDEEIVVCEDATGKRCYVSKDAWERVSATFLDSDGTATAERPVVTAQSSSAEKLALFKELFSVRTDVYVKSYFNRKAQRVGYSVACENEWKHGVCGKAQKPPIRCSACKERQYTPLDDAALLAHFRGQGQPGMGIIAGYPLIDESKTKVLVVDFDKADWKQSITAFWEVCDSKKIPLAVERSRSGNGAHAWIFFSELVEASEARKLGCALLTKAMQVNENLSFDSYDRLFPNQDSAPIDGFGNAIALPFQGYAMSSKNSVFVDKQFCPHPDQWLFLSSVKRLSSADLTSILRLLGKRYLGDLSTVSDSADVDFAKKKFIPAKHKQGEMQTLWKVLPDKKLNKVDMPDCVKITQSSLLLIGKEGLPPQVVNKLKRLAAFSNPEFYRAQAMRRSVHLIPRILYFGEDVGNSLGLPRGCQQKVLEVLDSIGVQLGWEDARCVGHPIKVEFRGVLREEQLAASDEMLKHDAGVLVAHTSFGKTVVAAHLISQRKVSTLVLVSRAALLKQWQDRLMEFLDIDEQLPDLFTPSGRKSNKKRSIVGQIGGGCKLPSGFVDIAVLPSLFQKGEIAGEKHVADLVQNYGMIICDECHHAASVSFEKVLRSAKAKYVYGLTATPKRSDGLQPILFLQCGPVRYFASKDKQATYSRVMVPRFTKTCLTEAKENDFVQILDELRVDDIRNDLIINDVARELDAGKTSLVLTRRVEHAVVLEKNLKARGYMTILLIGSDSSKLKQEKMAQLALFEKEKPFAIVATGSYIGEGFDDNRLDVLFLAAPVSWSGLLSQYIGRLHREREGKREVIVYDYVDMNICMLDRMYRKRLKEYAAQGYSLSLSESAEDVRGEFVASAAYAARYENDLDAASESILISASKVYRHRVEKMLPCLESVIARGVKVCVLLPVIKSEESREAHVVSSSARLLKEAGVTVVLREVCPNLTIVDKRLVWYGCVSAFSFPLADEQLLRFMGSDVACELSLLFEG